MQKGCNMLSRVGMALRVTLLGLLALSSRPVEGHGLSQSLQRLRESESVAVVEGKLYTVGDLTMLLGMRSARYRPNKAMVYGIEDLVMQARHAPVYRRLAEEAEQAGVRLSPSEEEGVQAGARAFARRLLLRREVFDMIAPPTDADLRAIHEEVKEERLATPERFIVRRIRMAADDEAGREEAERVLSLIRDEVMAGGDVVPVARARGLEAPSRVLYPEQEEDPSLVEALRGVPDGSVLAPRQLDGATEMVVRQLHIPGDTIPFESSVEMLLRIYHDREARRLGRGFFLRLADEPGNLLLVPENLQSVGELALDSDVVLVVAGRPVTRREMKDGLGWMAGAAGRGDLEAFRQRVLDSGVVQEALMDRHLGSVDQLRDAEVRSHAQYLAETLLARRMLMEPATALMVPAVEEDVLEHWRDKEASMGRFHGRVRYDQVGLPARVEGTAGWRNKLAGVATAEEFARVSREITSAVPGAILISGLQGHVAALPPAVNDRIVAGDVPGVVVTTPGENEPLVALWITEGTADRRPTDEERDRSRLEVEEMRLQDAMERVLDEMSEQVTMEVLILRSY